MTATKKSGGALCLAMMVLIASAPSHAATVVATPADVAAKIAALQPGDILELRADAGHYTDGLPIYNVNGTASQRITIRGQAGGARPIIDGIVDMNVIRIRSSSYLTVKDLELNGMGRNGFGVAADGGNCPHDITIENLHIHDLEMDNQVVAIAANGCSGVSWNWTIRGNRLERVGMGMYLGSSTGAVPFVAGLIEYNTIIETVGYNIEVKQQNPRSTVAGMPTGDSRTIIRHNVFSKSATTSSTGSLARPNLLVGHWPLSGVGQNDRYEIYGNFFFQNPVEVLFQGEGNLYFYNNVLYNSLESAVAIQRHNDAPRDIHVFNNTIVTTGTGISISGGVAGLVQEAFGNAVYAATPLSGGSTRDNVTGTFAQAATFLNSPSATIANLDLFPKSPLTGSTINYTSVNAPAGALGAGTDWSLDFNGTTQPGNVRGAYVGSGTNPGWHLALEQKATSGTTPIPAPTVTFTATPTTVALNGISQLSWSSDGSNCVATGGWTGAKSSQSSEQVGPLTTATTYTLTCSNSGGSTSRSVTVSILSAPTVTLSANPTAVASGARTTLSWSSTNATSCTAGGAWAGSKSTAGSEQSAVLTMSSDFSLTCSGTGGSTSRSVTVSILPAPTVTLSANPTTVASGTRTTLTWSSTNASSCVANGAWAGSKSTTGSEQSAVLTMNSDFSLTCSGTGGSTTSSVVGVTVTATTPTPTPTPPSAGDSSGGGALDTKLLVLLALLAAVRIRRRTT